MTVTATPDEYLDARQPHWLDAERTGAVKYDALPRVVSITDPEIRRAFLVTVSAEIRAVVGVLALLLAGCSLSPSAEVIDALAKDPASFSLSIRTIYGSIQLCRTGILSGSVQCNPDGLSVKSESATIGVPLTIVPQFSIGAPAGAVIQPPPTRPMHQAPAPRSEAPSPSSLWAPPSRGMSPTHTFADWLAQPTVDVRALLRDMPR